MRKQLSQQVKAPVARTFEVFSDFKNLPSRVASVTRTEILTPGEIRKGSRIRQTGSMLGREGTEEIEVVELERNRTMTIACDTHGAHIETRFDFAAEGSGTRVDVTLTVEARSLAARLMLPMASAMSGPVEKAIAQDLTGLARAAEGASREAR